MSTRKADDDPIAMQAGTRWLQLWDCKGRIHGDNLNMSKTLHEIEQAIGTLPLPERLQLYKDMPQLIGRSAEYLDWQRLGLEHFFQDDSPDDSVYDSI